MAGRTGKALTITLTKQLAERVKERVASGEYASESEVIRDGLRALEERSSHYEADLGDWLQTEGRKRLKEYEANPDNVISASDMRAKVRGHIAKRRGARK